MGPLEYLSAWLAQCGRRLDRGMRRGYGAVDDAVAALGGWLVRVAAIKARLTLAWAVLLGAALIAAALLLAPLVAPYRFEAAGSDGFWRFDSVTGTATGCTGNALEWICGDARRPEDRNLRDLAK